MDKKTLALLILIIFLGITLRVYNIGKESFWIDESATAMSLRLYNAREILYNTLVVGNILPNDYPAVTDPPVYYITLHYWAKLFSISEASLRMYSVLIWLFSAVFMFLTANMLLGKRTAIISSFLFSISIPSIAFSQEARGYMLYLFFGLTSMYYLFKALNENKNFNWVMYTVFVVLGIYTHHLFSILLFFQLLYATFDFIIIKKYSVRHILGNLFRRKEMIRMFYSYLAIGLFLIPAALRMLRENNAWWAKPTITSAVKLFMNFATWIYPTAEGRDKINDGLFLQLGNFDMLLLFSVAVTAIVSYSLILYLTYVKLRKCRAKDFFFRENKIIFLFGWLAFPLAFSLTFSVVTPISIFSTFHYFFYGLPPFIMLLAMGMLEFKHKYFKFLLIVFILVNLVPLYAYYHNVDKQQWRELAQYMKNNLGKNEPVLISIYSGETSFRYYFGDYNQVYGVKGLDEEAKSVLKDSDRVWLVLTLWKYYDPKGTLQEYIDANYELIKEEKKFFDIEVYHYKKKVKIN